MLSSRCDSCATEFNSGTNQPKIMPCCGFPTCAFCISLQCQRGYVQCVHCRVQHVGVKSPADFVTNQEILRAIEGTVSRPQLPHRPTVNYFQTPQKNSMAPQINLAYSTPMHNPQPYFTPNRSGPYDQNYVA
jgi:hypothetical protein